jgi:hypothetical protein
MQLPRYHPHLDAGQAIGYGQPAGPHGCRYHRGSPHDRAHRSAPAALRSVQPVNIQGATQDWADDFEWQGGPPPACPWAAATAAERGAAGPAADRRCLG